MRYSKLSWSSHINVFALNTSTIGNCYAGENFSTYRGYFNKLGQEKCTDKLYSRVPPILTFTAMTCHAMYNVTNHYHLLCIPLVWRMLHSDSSFQKPLLYGGDSQGNTSSVTTILASTSLWLTVLFLLGSYNNLIL